MLRQPVSWSMTGGVSPAPAQSARRRSLLAILIATSALVASAAPAGAALQLSSSTVATDAGPTHATLADLNADGHLDLVTANWGTGISTLNRTISIVPGAAGGGFGTKSEIYEPAG